MSAARSRRFYVATGIALAVLVALGLVCLLKAERKPVAAKAVTTRVPEKHWSRVVSSSEPLRIEKLAPPFPRGLAVPDRNRIKEIGPAVFSWGGQDLLKQRGSAYGYNSEMYGATLDQGTVQFTIRDRKEGPTGLGLRFEELRVGDEVLATGAAVAPRPWPEDRVVSYERGPVQEFYVLRPEALEQGYVVTELPVGRGPITVTAKVSTKLSGPESPEPCETLTFKRAGKDVVQISRAFAVDAQDRRLALKMSYEGGNLRIDVPADWVAQASLPIVIDPLIGSMITVDSSAAWPESERTVDVAYSPTDQNWLVVWNELFGGNFNWDVYGQLVSRTGSLVGGQIDISSSANGDRGLAVSYAPAPVNRFLVVWTHDPNNDGHTSDYRINGRVLNGNGSFVTSPFTVDDPARFDCQPNVAFDGTNWLVVWTNINDSTWTNADILGRFVSTAGVPGTGVNIDVDSDWASNASVDFASGTYCVTWSKGNSFSCAARTWNTSGTPLTPLTIVAGSNAKQMDVSAGGGKFLFVWRGDNPAQVNARISNSSLVFDGPAFLVKNGWADQVRAAYSPIDSQWFIINNENPGEVRGRKCSLTGTLGTVDQITSNSLFEYDPEIAWNSQDNEMLIVYRVGDAPNYMIQGQRYQMSPPPPSGPNPPTGLTATAGDGMVTLNWTTVTGATGYSILRSGTSGGPYQFLDFIPAPPYSDGYVVDNNTYYYVAQSVDAAGNSSSYSNQAFATPVPAGQKSILFVVGTYPIPPGTADEAIASRMTALGYTVVAISAAAATSGNASGKVLVAISATANATDVGTKFTGVSVPVITWQGDVLYNLGMISGNQPTIDYGTLTNQTQLAVYNNADPIIKSLTALSQPVNVSTASTYAWVKWSSWGGFSSIGATHPTDLNKTYIASYDGGVPMPGLNPAPAKRAFLFLSSGTGLALNATGQALFDAAVQWAIGAPSELKAVWASVGNQQVTLHWEGGTGATSFKILRSSTGLPGSFTEIATGVTGTSFVDTGRTNGQSNWYEVIGLNGTGQTLPSAAISAVPQPTTIVVAIKGAPYLRRRLQGEAADQYNSHTFEALVYRNGAKVNDNLIVPLAGQTNAWSATGVGTVALNPAQTVTKCTVVANDNPTGVQGDITLSYNIRVQADNDYEPVPTVKCVIHVDSQYRVQVKFHFPNDGGDTGGKRTSRSNYPNLFAADPDTQSVRLNERQRLAKDFVKGLQGQNNGLGNVWNQAAIDFYPDSNVTNDLNEKLDVGWGGVGDKEFVASTPGTTNASEGMQNLANKNTAGVVNVYFVRKIAADVNGVPAASTIRSLRAMVVSDTVVPGDNLLAHEMGHAMLLLDTDDPDNGMTHPVVTGTVNNVNPVFGNGVPTYRNYLMYGVVGHDDWLISEDEAKVTRIKLLAFRLTYGLVWDNP